MVRPRMPDGSPERDFGKVGDEGAAGTAMSVAPDAAAEDVEAWLRVALVAVLAFLVIVLSIIYIHAVESLLLSNRVPTIVLALGFLSASFATACLYLLPAIVAYRRRKLKAPTIFILNFFFGWTIVGWAGTLAWAIRDDAPPA